MATIKDVAREAGVSVATVSREVRKIVAEYFEETAADASKPAIDFVLNDFGFRLRNHGIPGLSSRVCRVDVWKGRSHEVGLIVACWIRLLQRFCKQM